MLLRLVVLAAAVCAVLVLRRHVRRLLADTRALAGHDLAAAVDLHARASRAAVWLPDRLLSDDELLDSVPGPDGAAGARRDRAAVRDPLRADGAAARRRGPAGPDRDTADAVGAVSEHVSRDWSEAERIVRTVLAGRGNDSIDVADALAEAGIIDVRPDPMHRYLSTGCLHGEHAYCQSMTGVQGEKRPGRCKFCDAQCRCACHRS